MSYNEHQAFNGSREEQPKEKNKNGMMWAASLHRRRVWDAHLDHITIDITECEILEQRLAPDIIND